MSVIVYRDAVIAADCQNNLSGSISRTRKLFKHGNDVLGFVGTSCEGHLMIDWYLSGRNKKDFPKASENDWTCLIVLCDGELYEYENNWFPQIIESEFYARGSGADVAKGAMGMGATAIQAVKIANKYNAFCGQGVDYYDQV